MIKRYPLVTIPLRNGLLAGVLGVIFPTTLYYLGRHPFLIPVYFDFRIILFSVMIVVTLKEFRDYYRQGILFFWQGMVMSLLFTVIFSLIASSLLWAFGHWKPEFVTQFVTLYKEQVRASPPPQIIDQIGKKAFEQNLKALDATTAGDVAWLYAKQSFMISFFVSIIISVILRRQPNPK